MIDQVISIDAESNGLGGQAFAVALTLSDSSGELQSSVFRSPINGVVDPWVAGHVLPVIADVPENVSSYVTLLDEVERTLNAWRARSGTRPDGVPVIAHVPWPVEARLLLDVYSGPRIWGGPFPLIDVASIMLALGHDPTSVDSYLDARGIERPTGSPHHPLYDVRAAERCFRDLVNRVDEVDPTLYERGWRDGRHEAVHNAYQLHSAAIAAQQLTIMTSAVLSELDVTDDAVIHTLGTILVDKVGGLRGALDRWRERYDPVVAAQPVVIDPGEHFHVMEIRQNGWTIKHPIACRPDLFNCPVNRAASAELEPPALEPGQYRVDLDDRGELKMSAVHPVGIPVNVDRGDDDTTWMIKIDVEPDVDPADTPTETEYQVTEREEPS